MTENHKMFDTPADESTLLRSETPLTSAYSPEYPVGREDELREIELALEPLTRRKSPDHLLVHGPAGIGKSTVISHALEELAANTRVGTAWINCWQHNTRPSLHTELLIQLGYPVPRKGNPVDTVLARLQEWLDKHTGVGIALDEFDQLRTPAQVIYDLLEIGRQADHNIGLILISNQSPNAFDLDTRSDSRLRYRSVEFEPYVPAELKEILRRRADQAFRDSALGEHVIEGIVNRVTDAGGDCRKAFTLLLRAGQYAEREDASQVTVDHVDQVAPVL